MLEIVRELEGLVLDYHIVDVDLNYRVDIP
jgi:hypothetical protein